MYSQILWISGHIICGHFVAWLFRIPRKVDEWGAVNTWQVLRHKLVQSKTMFDQMVFSSAVVTLSSLMFTKLEHSISIPTQLCNLNTSKALKRQTVPAQYTQNCTRSLSVKTLFGSVSALSQSLVSWTCRGHEGTLPCFSGCSSAVLFHSNRYITLTLDTRLLSAMK